MTQENYLECPKCGYTLMDTIRPLYYHNLLVGSFKAVVCMHCNSIYRDKETSNKIVAVTMNTAGWMDATD